MNIYHRAITIKTVAERPSYHDMSDEIKAVIEQANIQNGLLTITTPHTTCSLFFDECMHDTNYFGDDYLHVDINNVLDNIVPKMTSENQYNSPGPKHIEFGLSLSDPNYPAEKWVMLNTDAHIRSSLFGCFSASVIIKERVAQLGELGRIYFVDWDGLRERNRIVNFMTMGN